MDTAISIQERYAKDLAFADNPLLKEDPRLSFEKPADVLFGMEQFPIIEFGEKKYYSASETIAYDNQTSQKVFNKNFDLLIQDLKSNEKNKITNFIFAENPKQIERFYHIFEDLKAAVTFFPIPKSIHIGFTDASLGLAIYTDHQIFNRYHKYKIRQGYSKDKALIIKTLNELAAWRFCNPY
jgi:transcription-repair coupling factor (superfamily II helicase)